MNPVNIAGGLVFVLAGLVGLLRPRWIARIGRHRGDPDWIPVYRVTSVLLLLLLLGLFVAHKGLTSPAR